MSPDPKTPEAAGEKSSQRWRRWTKLDSRTPTTSNPQEPVDNISTPKVTGVQRPDTSRPSVLNPHDKSQPISGPDKAQRALASANPLSDSEKSLNTRLQRSMNLQPGQDGIPLASHPRSTKRQATEQGVTVNEALESKPAKRPYTPPAADDGTSRPIVLSTPVYPDKHARPSDEADRPDHQPSHTADSSPRDSQEVVVFQKQLATKEINKEQLIQEVRGIYAGLVMVEGKCKDIIESQTRSKTKLTNEQWQAILALHRTLLHEHHDFFSASQHPAADHNLKKLALKYAMPARMWKHGIHAPLELLRHRLPDSLEHMLVFVYLAYSIMGLLMESVPNFKETWIECLGDLARYRMAIEEVDMRDREIWSNTARTWYDKAADLSPNVGRIQHHLAVLARPNIVAQLFFYSKSLVAATPFKNARESIMLVFTPLLKPESNGEDRYRTVEVALVTLAARLFTRGPVGEALLLADVFRTNLSDHLARTRVNFKTQGVEIGLSLFAMAMDFGDPDSFLWTCYLKNMATLKQLESQKDPDRHDAIHNDRYVVQDAELMRQVQQKNVELLRHLNTPVTRLAVKDYGRDLDSTAASMHFQSSEAATRVAAAVLYDTTSILATMMGDKNVVPFFHVLLATLWSMTYVPGALPYVEAHIPWAEVKRFLNTIGRSGVSDSNVESEDFPTFFAGTGRQLPEDFSMRGLATMLYFYPREFWSLPLVDEDDREIEWPSHQAPRVERCLWCGVRLASLNRYLTYDSDTKLFDVTLYAVLLGRRRKLDMGRSPAPATLTTKRSPTDLNMLLAAAESINSNDRMMVDD